MSFLDSKRIVGTNAQRIGTFADISGGWKELARTTLGSAGDNINVSSLADKRYYMILANQSATGGNTGALYRLNGDTGTNYAWRYSADGGAETIGTSETYGFFGGVTDALPEFSVGYLANVSSKEKLAMMHTINQNTAGAGTAPQRRETVGKHAQTSNPINAVNCFNVQSGDFAIGSEVVVLGYDPDDTHTDNFWEELASVDLSGGTADDISSGTFTAKKYLWVQCFMEQDTSSITGNVTFNSDTGSNYARRRSNNGSTDATGTSESSIDVRGGETKNRFENMFIINNSAQEKLVIGHMVVTTAGGSNAPDRTEYVAKWANTSSQITSINFNNIDPGNYGTKSFIKVWGSN